MKDVFEKLEEFLNNAHGEVRIEVNGMIPHVEGNLNDAGALMATFGLLKLVEQTQCADFDELLEKFKALNEIMKYEIVGEMPERKKHGCKDN